MAYLSGAVFESLNPNQCMRRALSAARKFQRRKESMVSERLVKQMSDVTNYWRTGSNAAMPLPIDTAFRVYTNSDSDGHLQLLCE